MDVSIIIVNYNTRDLTYQCLKSIYEQTNNLKFEIIVVDNNSDDDSQQIIKTNFPKVKLIESKVNLGFGKANNVGARMANGEFLFLLNPDCILIENSINYLHNFYLENESKLKIGVLGGILVNNELSINNFGGDFPTCLNEIRNYFKNLFKKVIGLQDNLEREILPIVEDQYFEIDYVSGADILMRKKLYTDFQGFADCFFMYFDETDLQKRISRIGLKSYIFCRTKIIHLEDSSSYKTEKISQWKRITYRESKMNYLRRNDKIMFPFYWLFNLSFGLVSLLNRSYSFRENLIFYRTGLI